MGQRYEAFLSFVDRLLYGMPAISAELAADIEKMLSGRGIKILSSQLSRIPDQKALDSALGDASVLIIVATSPAQLESTLVKYAWTRFVDDEASGIKPKGSVILYIEGFEPYQLPSPLRKYRAITHGEGSLGRLFNAVAKALGPTDERPFLDLARELYEAMTNISEEVYAAGWLYDWEHPLWDHAFNHPFQGLQTSIGINRDVPVSAINHVMELSMKCQGWIVFDDVIARPSVDSDR